MSNLIKHILLACLCLFVAGCKQGHSAQKYLDGDIIFHTSMSSQSKAIQFATGSNLSHVGIIYFNGSEPFVFEAVEPVKTTSLGEWIERGEGGKFQVRRLKNRNAILTKEKLKEMKAVGEAMRGKHYDLAFDWSDEKQYCSELVWKVYKRGADVELSKPKRLKDFNLAHPAVKKKLFERYGKNVPLEGKVVSPVDLLESELLIEVQQ